MWFEFLLPLLTAAGVAGLGAAASIIDGATWVVLECASKSGHLDPLVRAMGENAGAFG